MEAAERDHEQTLAALGDDPVNGGAKHGHQRHRLNGRHQSLLRQRLELRKYIEIRRLGRHAREAEGEAGGTELKRESGEQQNAAGVNQRREPAGERFVQNSDERGWAQVAAKRLDEQSPGYFLQRGQQRRAGLRNQHHEDGELQSADEIVRSGKLPLLARFDQPPRCCLFRLFARGIHACVTESKPQQPSQRGESLRAQLLIQLGNQQNQKAQGRQRRQHLRGKRQSDELQLRIEMA